MSWRLAKSLEQLRQQVNVAIPGRSKIDDGTIGDEAHASRESDHNPWLKDAGVGIVTALDITHDPAHGFDSYAFADMLCRKKDGRIKYVISNRRIASGAGEDHIAWSWRPYDGKNPHDHHIHISVKSDKPRYDSVAPWDLDFAAAAMMPSVPHDFIRDLPTLRQGASGLDVEHLQDLLNKNGLVVTVDGNFGLNTEAAVRSFQSRAHLFVDGVVGGYTWRALQSGLA